MADEEKKKSIFDRAIDALTDRDEKAAAAEAARKAEAAAAQAAEDARLKAAADEAARKQSADLARQAAAEEAGRKAAAEKAAAEKRAAEAEAKMREMKEAEERREQQAHMEEERRKYAEVQARLAEQAKPKFIGEHHVASGDTLGQIALNYYGHATREYWMVIYEANKVVIGDNPGMIRPGTVLQIPELPEALKDK